MRFSTILLLIIGIHPHAISAEDLQITELYPGIDGNNSGTLDWIEITNLGDSEGSTFGSSLSTDFFTNIPLPEVTITPNESVIFLFVDNNKNPQSLSHLQDFLNLWGTYAKVVLLENSQLDINNTGDTVRLFKSGSQIDNAWFPNVFSNDLRTTEYIPGQAITNPYSSWLTGRYNTTLFNNSERSSNPIYLIGSPGRNHLTPPDLTDYQKLSNRLSNKFIERSATTGNIQLSEDDTSSSFHWEIRDAGNGYVFIKSQRLGSVAYLRQDNEGTIVRANTLNPFSWAFYWKLESSEGFTHIKNRLSGDYLRSNFQTNTLKASPLSNSWGFDWTLTTVLNSNNNPWHVGSPPPISPPFPPKNYQHLYNRLNNNHIRQYSDKEYLQVNDLTFSWGFDWEIVNAGEGYIFLKTRLNGELRYLKQLSESKEIRAFELDSQDHGFYWKIEETGEYIHLLNRSSNQYMRTSKDKNYIYAANLTNSWGFDWRFEDAKIPVLSPINDQEVCELSEQEQELLTLHNEARAVGRTCGDTYYPAVDPVVWNCKLAYAAEKHSEDMATFNYFSHGSIDGRTLVDRVNAVNYAYRFTGENIAAGYSTPSAAVQGWINSPGHCRNLMSDNYTEMGGGIAYNPNSNYSIYWTINFGNQFGN